MSGDNDDESFDRGIAMTQDFVEWDDSQEVDLRTLATRSPTLALATPTSAKALRWKPSAISVVRAQPSSSKRKTRTKDKNYSPGQEVEGILKTLLIHSKGLNASDPNLDVTTKAHANLVRSTTYPPASTAVGLRHRRKRRVEQDQHYRKRILQVKGGISTRPESADSSQLPSLDGSSTMDHLLGFHDLLKQLDQSKARRIRPTSFLKKGSNSQIPNHESQSRQYLHQETGTLHPAMNRQQHATKPLPGKENTFPINQSTFATNQNKALNHEVVCGRLHSPSPLKGNTPIAPPLQPQNSLRLELETDAVAPHKNDKYPRSTPRNHYPTQKVQPKNSHIGPTATVTTLPLTNKLSTLHTKKPAQIMTAQVQPMQPDFEQTLASLVPTTASQHVVNRKSQKVVATITSSLKFDDDLEFSAEDLLALDAAMFEATRARETSNAAIHNNFNSGKHSHLLQPVPAVSKVESPIHDPFDDPYCDDLFTQMDFDAIDKKIEERNSLDSDVAIEIRPLHAAQTPRTKVLAPPPVNVPVRNKVSTDYDASNDFITFSRYRIIAVIDDMTSYTKTVVVKAWSSDMLNDLCDKSIHRFSTSLAHKKKEFGIEDADGSIFLRGEWYHTHLDSGDIVHLCSLSGKYETKLAGLPVILHTAAPVGSDSTDDLVLVVNPDLLVPPTIISETVSCSRRAVLKSRVGSTGLTSKAALLGTMRHELFERSMRSQDFSVQAAGKFVHAISREFAGSLVALGITNAEAQKEVIRVLPQLQQFALNYTSFGMLPATRTPANVKGSILEGNGIQPDLHFLAGQVHATEESHLSPELGMKGNIDCTIQAKTHELHFSGRPEGAPQHFLYSIELKTGHNQTTQNAHMAQLALYTLMLKIRYGSGAGKAADSGVLLYLNNEGCRAVRVKPMLNELKSLIGQRNVVASEIKKSSRPRGVVLNFDDESTETGLGTDLLPAPPTDLPEVLSNVHACKLCYSNRECMMYLASDTNNAKHVVPSNNLQKSHGQLLNHFTGHLKPDDLNYFRDWDRLIDLEADATTHSTTISWLIPSPECEAELGTTVSSLVLDLSNPHEQASIENNNDVDVNARRSKESPLVADFTSLNIEPGNHVILSTDATSLSEQRDKVIVKGIQSPRRQMQIARGSLATVEKDRIVIRFSVQEYSQITLYVSNLGRIRNIEHITFRLDKDEVSTGVGTLRQNLINLFTTDITPFGSKESDPRLTQGTLVRNRFSWLRDVVVRLRSPVFGDLPRNKMFARPTGVFETLPGCNLEILRLDFEKLNDDQQRAVEKVFNANDYSLIQGMPGTGKTSVTAFVARLLAAHGKRVLITSYTHAAVDNLMMKLIEGGLTKTGTGRPISGLVRIGSKSACHPSVHSILVPEIALSRDSWGDELDLLPSADSLLSVISSARIVGVTALTVPRSPLLVGQNFDVVIVDEAGQISQPAILGALAAADSFVLVGDHMQLPPLVNSEIAEKGGLGISMLRRLADKYPRAVSQLTIQYRMHEQICNLCNEIVYKGKLRCGNEEVKEQRLSLALFPAAIPISDRWLTNVVNPSRPVVFIDTDPNTRTMTGVQIAPIVGLETSLGKQGRGSTVNHAEARIVGKIVNGLLACGTPVSSIGIISPFRAQLRMFEDIPNMAKWRQAGLEASTIDRYQGRDKDVIIISFVRSNPKGKAGRLLEDARRLNVAVSRAKAKLILVGSYSTLHRGSEVLRPVLEGLRKRNQVQHFSEQCIA